MRAHACVRVRAWHVTDFVAGGLDGDGRAHRGRAGLRMCIYCASFGGISGGDDHDGGWTTGCTCTSEVLLVTGARATGRQAWRGCLGCIVHGVLGRQVMCVLVECGVVVML